MKDTLILQGMVTTGATVQLNKMRQGLKTTFSASPGRRTLPISILASPSTNCKTFIACNDTPTLVSALFNNVRSTEKIFAIKTN